MAERYQPKRGDRVRVTFEDEVESGYEAKSGYYFELTDYGFNLNDNKILSVEKVDPPLPKTDGSVIRVRFNNSIWLTLIFDGGTGEWRSSAGRAVTRDPRDAYRHVEVVYDARPAK